ncbi:MAG: gliding motility-associated C-terminal domain-containing protein [Flavobacteriia bacterium]|nr:gliding motility-associated C-terminal domain-containing protein [Flavobacteriia bacterium]OJX37111.1 MAG: hypothetical protein BGO87_15225 [Flavobacteriia bacterium 40-80]
MLYSLRKYFFGFYFLFFNFVLFSQSPETFNQPGTYTWAVPPCVTSITVKVWGGGGGGGGTSSKHTIKDEEACTQGGGGGFATRTYAVTPGEIYSIVVGAGGAGGVGANSTAVAGATGGTSTFSGPATTPFGALTGFGGTGGGGATAYNNNTGNHHIGSNGTGGIGGTGANGTTIFTGGNASDGSHSASCADISGAGGGGAGTTGNGSNGQQIGGCPHNAAMNGGTGGVNDGGKGADGIKNNIASKHNKDGNAGSPYGGGGSGAGIHISNWTNQWVLANGGDGASGAVIIEYVTDGALPSQPSVISGNTVLPCGGGTENYSIVNEPGVTYTWSYSGSGTITGNGNTATLTATTGGTITVTPAGACGNGPSRTINITTDIPPTTPVTITGPTQIACTGTQHTYTANNIPNTIYTWTYSGNGTITGNGTNEITLDIVTGGTLTVTTSNSCGSGSTNSIQITIGQSTFTLQPIQGNTLLPCGGGTESYSVNALSDVTYNWSYSGNGTITGNGTNSITLNATTGGTLTVTATNSCGTVNTVSTQITIDQSTVSLQPIQGNTLIPCGGATGNYSVNSLPDVTYNWSYSGVGTITGNGTNSITLNATSGGVLTVTAQNNCGDLQTQSITITLDSPNTTINFSLPAHLCKNDPAITLSATPAGGEFTSNNTVITVIDPSVLNPGTYTITYAVSENSCLFTANQSVEIRQLPVLSNNLAAEYCHGSAAVNIQFSPAGGTASGEYLTGTTLHLENAVPGPHSVSYTYTDSYGCTSSRTDTYTITEKISPDIMYEKSCNYLVNFHTGNAAYTYYWDFKEKGHSTAKNPSVQFDGNGIYPVDITVTDSKGCSVTVQQTIELSENSFADLLKIPNVITPNKDGINDNFELNPGLFNCGDLSMLIINRWGNTVYQMDQNSIKFEGKMSDGKELSDGVYFYIITSEKFGCKNGIGGPNCNGVISIVR